MQFLGLCESEEICADGCFCLASRLVITFWPISCSLNISCVFDIYYVGLLIDRKEKAGKRQEKERISLGIFGIEEERKEGRKQEARTHTHIRMRVRSMHSFTIT